MILLSFLNCCEIKETIVHFFILKFELKAYIGRDIFDFLYYKFTALKRLEVNKLQWEDDLAGFVVMSLARHQQQQSYLNLAFDR
jgi:hypothetical protein